MLLGSIWKEPELVQRESPSLVTAPLTTHSDIAPSTALDPNEFNKLNGNSGSAFDFEAFLQMDALDYDYNFLFDSV